MNRDNLSSESVKFLIFDTETNGLLSNNQADTSGLKWPRLVSLAYILVDRNNKILHQHDSIIWPEDFKIKKSASKIHGITQQHAMLNGSVLEGQLDEFKNYVEKATHLVAHNIDFDLNIMKNEYSILGQSTDFLNMPTICTMKQSAEYCNIRLQNGMLKWPGLEELHSVLFHEGLKNVHDALEDTKATMRCLYELLDRDIISKPYKLGKPLKQDVMYIKDKITSIRSFIESLSYADNISTKQINVLSSKVEDLFELLEKIEIEDEYEAGENTTQKHKASNSNVELDSNFDDMDDDLPF